MYKDPQSIIKGLIPWSKKEFQEINSKLEEQLKKPKDDWEVNYVSLPGMDQYHPINIVSTYMNKKYSNRDVFAANLLRYNKIIKFLRKYEKELIQDGFLHSKDNKHFIKDELIESLCLLPFSQISPVENIEEKYDFSFNDVIEHSWKLVKERNQ